MCRAEELQNDLENLDFSRRYYIGVLAELEQLGRTHTREYHNIERGIQAINHNIRRIQKELAI